MRPFFSSSLPRIGVRPEQPDAIIAPPAWGTYVQVDDADATVAAVRRLIERKVPVDAAALADPAQPFNAMLKAKA